MKATGIVRRIDDLGRVVIPKEIRRTMRIREGDPLEIYTDADGEVIFKKYSPMGELGAFAEQICESMSKTAGLPAAVCDRDSVIAAAGARRREVLDRHISAQLEQVMEARRPYCARESERPLPVTAAEGPLAEIAVPVLSQGDVLGCVLFLQDGTRRGGELEVKLAATVAGFLGKQMET